MELIEPTFRRQFIINQRIGNKPDKLVIYFGRRIVFSMDLAITKNGIPAIYKIGFCKSDTSIC